MKFIEKDFLEEWPLWLAEESIPYLMIEGMEERFESEEAMKVAFLRECKPAAWVSEKENFYRSLLWETVANDSEAMELLFAYQKAFYYSWDYSDTNAVLPSEWSSVIARIHGQIIEKHGEYNV